MQASDDGDLHGCQRSSEVKCGKLCAMATKFGQKNCWCKLRMMMTFTEVKGHQRSNVVNYVLWLPYLVKRTADASKEWWWPQVLSASLQYIPQLTELHLSNNNIKSEGVQALSASLQYIPILMCLHFSNNNIGTKGAQALSGSLQYIPQLVWLDCPIITLGQRVIKHYRVSKNVLYPKMQNFKNFYYNKDNRI